MKRIKKVLALVLAGVLAVSALTACNSGTETTTTSAAPGDSTASGTAADPSKQEPYTVKIMMFDDGKTDIVNEVAAAASKITQAKFNTTIEITRVGWGSWAQQVNLALTSGEKLDLFPAFGLNTSLTSMATTGQVIPLDDLLAQYGQQTQAAISSADWKCDTIGGKIYGVPMNKGKQNVIGAAVDKNIADQLGIDLTKISSLETLGDALAVVKKAHPDMYPLATSNGKMTVAVPADGLGDSRDCVLGGLVNAFDSSTKVVNIYDTDAYRKYVETMYSWAQKGYIMPDGSSNTEAGEDLIKAGVSFANLYTGPAPDTEARLTRQIGKPIKDVLVFQPYATTSETSPCWSIAANSEKPERAMQVLNEMYNNQELGNILMHGIEGKQFTFVDSDKKVIDYPKGVDASNAGYNFDEWGWPNMQLSYIWNGYPQDVNEQYAKFNASGHQSPAYGFTFDNSSVMNEYTACTNVVNKYVNALNCGSLNPAENLPKFNQELKNNGIDKIIAEKQKQFDVWRGSQQ